MNLHGLASSIISAVNPTVPMRVSVSDGYFTNVDGSRTPQFLPAVTVPGQVQALTFKDLTQLEGVNIEGERRAIYLNGRINGIVRAENTGGDLIELEDGSRYLVAMVLEFWPDWTKVAATLQRHPYTSELGIQPEWPSP